MNCGLRLRTQQTVTRRAFAAGSWEQTTRQDDASSSHFQFTLFPHGVLHCTFTTSRDSTSSGFDLAVVLDCHGWPCCELAHLLTVLPEWQRCARMATRNPGILFETVFHSSGGKHTIPRAQSDHGVVLGYAGHVYTCNKDTESVRSVHTICTDDEDELDTKSDTVCQSRTTTRKSSSGHRSPSPCLKNSPRKSARPPAALLKPSPRKLKRSRTLSPPKSSKRRSMLAPFTSFSRKFSIRRHSSGEEPNPTTVKDPKLKQEAPSKQTVREMPPASRQFPGNTFAPYVLPMQYPSQPVMYHYVPMNQNQQPVGSGPFAYTQASSSMPQSAPASAPQFPPQLKQLQDTIDRTTAFLAANPVDLALKSELARLLAERNAFLDSATKQNTRNEVTIEPRPVKEYVPQKITGEIEKSIENVQNGDDISLAPIEKDLGQEDVAMVMSGKHVCSGCGEPRSTSFHKKYPFEKPVHNVCRKCREGRRRIRVMERYHFCQDCGIVRSKQYQRSHADVSPRQSRSKICRKCYLSKRIVCTDLPCIFYY